MSFSRWPTILSDDGQEVYLFTGWRTAINHVRKSVKEEIINCIMCVCAKKNTFVSRWNLWFTTKIVTLLSCFVFIIIRKRHNVLHHIKINFTYLFFQTYLFFNNNIFFFFKCGASVTCTGNDHRNESCMMAISVWGPMLYKKCKYIIHWHALTCDMPFM